MPNMAEKLSTNPADHACSRVQRQHNQHGGGQRGQAVGWREAAARSVSISRTAARTEAAENP